MIDLQHKKTLAIILTALFFVLPLASAGNDWGISKDWTLANPNATLIPTPTPTATPTVQSNSSATPNPSSATATPIPTATPIGQTPTPTSEATENPTVTHPIQIKEGISPWIVIAAIIIVFGIAMALLYFALKQKRSGDAVT